jgi:hypothetical protein
MLAATTVTTPIETPTRKNLESFSREQQGRDGDCAQHAHHAREQADTRIEQQLFGDGRNPMLHGFMRSVTGSLSRFAMQHAQRELRVFSSTTTEV